MISYGPLLDALRGVQWPASRPVAAGLPGAHVSRMRGASPEFTEYRPYRQGDDPRRIDWRLLARSDRAYIRLADDRSILSTVIVVDASASMAFPTGARSKWERACEVAVGLAAIAHAAADPVGVVVPAPSGAVRVAARNRRGVVAEIARALGLVKATGSTPVAPALAGIARSSRMVLVSDFLDGSEELLRAAGERGAAGAEVIAVHVVADEELDPSERLMMAVDPEASDIRRTLGGASRNDYLQAFGEWREQLARDWRSAGADYTMVTTGEPADRAVRRVVGSPAATRA